MGSINSSNLVSGLSTGQSISSPSWLPPVKVVPPGTQQSLMNLSASAYMEIYTTELKYQDPASSSGNDVTSMINATVQLQQIGYYSMAQQQTQALEALLSQMTTLNSINMIGKEFVFSTSGIDTTKNVNYYLDAPTSMSNVTVEIMNSNTPVKTITMSLTAGLNPLNLSNLPPGQYGVQILSNGIPNHNVKLGLADIVQSVNLSGSNLDLTLQSGLTEPASNIIYAGAIPSSTTI
ncbi:flagellar hook assembly protein FlgD [Hydrogenobaculum acidophilum]